MANSRNIAIRDRITKFLQMNNVVSRVIVAGRPIDLLDLWHAVRTFEASPGNQVRPWLLCANLQRSYTYQEYDTFKFYLIGAQLGVPTDPQTGQITLQQVHDLEDDYYRVRTVFENTRNALACPPSSLSSDPPAPSPLQDILQVISGDYPELNFDTITPDMIPNPLYLPFEAEMKGYLSDLPQPVSDSRVVNNPLNYPVNDIEMPIQPNMMPALVIEEIIGIHEQAQSLWRRVYHTLCKWSDRLCCISSQYFPALPAFSLPNDIQLWNTRFTQAMLEMKSVVVGLGLFYHLRRDKQEMVHIIQMVSFTACHVEANVMSDTLA